MKKLLLILFTMSSIIAAQEYFEVEKNVLKKAENSNDLNSIEYKVFDESSNLIYAIEKNIYYDIPFPKLTLFNDGASVLVNSFEAKIEFFDDSGNSIAEAELGDYQPSYERVIYSSADKDNLILTLSDPSSEKTEVFIYDKYGSKVNRFMIDEQFVHGAAISDEVNSIIISTYDWKTNNLVENIKFFNLQGEFEEEIEGKFTFGYFNVKNKLFLSHSNNSVILYSLDDDLQLINFNSESSKEIIIDAKFSDEGIIILKSNTNGELVEGDWKYDSLEIEKYDISGSFLDKESLNSNSFINPKLDAQGKSIKSVGKADYRF